MIAVAAISAVSWYFVVALGVVKELNFAVGAASILEVYGLLLAAAIGTGVAMVWILPGRAGAIAAMLPRSSLSEAVAKRRQRRPEPQIADMPSHVMRRARSAFIGVGAFSLIINLLMLTTSLYMMQIFDRVLSGQSRETLLYLTIIAILAVAVLGTLDMIRSRILGRVGNWVERSLSSSVYLKGLDNAVTGRVVPHRGSARPRNDQRLLEHARHFGAVRYPLGSGLSRNGLPAEPLSRTTSHSPARSCWSASPTPPTASPPARSRRPRLPRRPACAMPNPSFAMPRSFTAWAWGRPWPSCGMA